MVAGLVAATAAALYARLLHGEEALLPGHLAVVLALPVLYALAEMAVIHVQFRSEASSFSLSEVVLVLGLVYATPGELVLARLLGGLVALVVHRRQPWLKVTFNLASFALDACVAVLVHRAVLGDAGLLSLRGWLAVLAAGLATLAVGSVTVSFAIAASEGRLPTQVLRGFVGVGVATSAAGATVGLVGVAALQAGEVAGWLLAVVAAGGFAAYRAHVRLRQEHRSLELIHDFSSTLAGAVTTAALHPVLLRELSDRLRADVVELVRRDPDGTLVAASWRDGQVTVVEGEEAEAVLAAHLALLAGAPSAIVPRGRATELPAGRRDAVVAELPGGDGGPAGTLLAADRWGDVDTFTAADERLVTTLAGHVTILLDNADLVARLRQEAVERERQALHDSLTGLPNRVLLDRELHRALAERSAGTRVAVLLIDLDRFKEVNDTLGHHQGDVLLQEVARRLRGAVGADAVAVRLGGDEFAVLATGLRSRDEVLALAHRVDEAVSAPFELDNLTLDVGGSIGVVMAPEHGDDPATLLQRADVAMYAAKDRATSVEVYDPAVDHHSPYRLALASELRHTVERRELLVEYQPKADLATGAIVGAEALARWHHPRDGFVSPDVFVAVAEHTGLIRALTEHVLDVAIAQCRAWHEQGHQLRVAVNLSTRNLLDDQLPEIVRGLLDRHRLPASALTLELTEGTIMADTARTVGILNRLASMGVSLSVDDFGTGYSSLAYLKRLPVDEIKIDRSFVRSMTRDDSDEAIVRSTIELARSLGLAVVAEGVEDEETWRLLRRLGCDRAQGYFLGRPMTASRFVAWLDERADEADSLQALLDEPPTLRRHQP